METYGSTVLGALSDPTRRAVLERLLAGPCSVGQLAEGLPVSRPAVSQHLRVLKDVGLVRDSHHGTRRVYAVAPEGVQALREYAEQLWHSAMQAFKNVADQAVPPSEEDHP